MNKFITIIFLLVSTAGTAFTQSKQEALDNYFSTLYLNQRFNGNVLVAENGNIVYQNLLVMPTLAIKG